MLVVYMKLCMMGPAKLHTSIGYNFALKNEVTFSLPRHCTVYVD